MASFDTDAVEVIEAHTLSGTFDASDIACAKLLLGLDQAHLFRNWEAPGVNDDKKKAFLAQVRKLDDSYHGMYISFPICKFY